MEQIRACIYTRVSTELQEMEGHSLEEQERLCKSAIESKEWVYTKTYVDAGKSGKTMERPALQKMIEDIGKHKMDVVFIYKLDRLSRSQKDTLTIIEDILLPNKVDIVSLKETLDTTTPWGRAMIGILASFNQLERENITVRTSMGLRAKAREGGYCGGKAPYGYTHKDKELVVVEEEAKVVREIFRLRSEGHTIRGIARALSGSGVLNHSGRPITSSTVQFILDNKDMYLGMTKYGDIKGVIGKHDAIITFNDTLSKPLPKPKKPKTNREKLAEMGVVME